MDAHDYADEFVGEDPAYAAETRTFLPGTRIEVAGPYVCSTCPDTPDRTYRDVHGGAMLPECPACGVGTKWERVEKA